MPGTTTPSVPVPVVESSADASSIVDQAIKQMEETKKMQDLQKQIEKEKKEEAKAKAKKDAILKLIKPKKEKKGKSKESTEEEKSEDLKKRMTIESVADEIQKLNPVKEDVVEQVESESALPPVPIISKPSVTPKLKSSKAAPSVESADPVETVKTDASMKFTGDEDIDENLYFHNHALSQMQKSH